jgi:serine protease Do
MKKSLVGFAALVLLVICNNAYAQKLNGKELEQVIKKGIEKAYPASVRIWGFDTVSKQQMSAQFSGVVVRPDGYILTAAHVDVPGKTYMVTFPDGRVCIAAGLGKIEYTQDHTIPDVAMMKIITKGVWPYAEMGWSSNLKQYEPCISIAYPESLNQPKPVVRFGYIANVKTERGFIQSTCIMEPGDSGGPLFDYMGRVIGLHSAITVAEKENYEVPVDLYKKYWTALNIAKVYSALPVDTDSLYNDPSASAIISIPELKNADANFQKITSEYKSSCLSIISINKNGEKQKALGTLFALSGNLLKQAGHNIIISKSSLIGNYPLVVAGFGRMITVKVIARDIKNDLVLLELATEIKGGIKFKKGDIDSLGIQPGQFLSSPLPDTISKASIVGNKPFSLPKMYSSGFLGAAIAYGTGPLSLTRIQPGSEADVIGLKIGDEVLSINDAPINKAPDYATELQKYWPGDTIKLQLKRAGFIFGKTAVLGTMPKPVNNHPAEFLAGGKSNRRDGFGQVFSHDATLKPYECGGPVFNLYGRFYGINIARYSRTSSLAIPSIIIYNFIEQTLK